MENNIADQFLSARSRCRKTSFHVVILAFVLIILGVFRVSAQNTPRLFIISHEDRTFIYHNMIVPQGHGFNIFRSDEPGAPFNPINSEPVVPAARLEEMMNILDDRYGQVSRFFEADFPMQLWMKLRTEPVESMIATALFPEVAEATGRLFIDEFAPIGQEATYRIEFVDMANNPTGETITGSSLLRPIALSPPSITRAENTGKNVVLHWHFQRAPANQPDYIIQFYLYRKTSTGMLEFLSNDVIIRNNATDNHSFSFESPVINTTETYIMKSVDFTGRTSPRSQEFIFEIIDNIAPAAIMQVNTEIDSENNILVSWDVSTHPRLAGYNIYRGTDMSEPFKKVNEVLLPPNATGFTDTTATGGYAYFYYVTAVDRFGNESGEGSISMAQLPDLLPPSMPSGFTASYNPETETVDLSWEKEKYSDNFKSFVILRRREDDSDEGAFSRITPDILESTVFADRGEAGTGFLEGTRYRYVLYSASRAYNYSDTLTLWVDIPILTPPDPPVSFTAVNDNGFRVNLSWGASMSRNLEGYVIYRKGEHDEEFMELARLGLSDRFYRDEQALVPGSHYIYTATATDIAGNESVYATPDTLHFRNFNPPSSIRNLQAAARDTGIELQWERVAATDLAGYRVYRASIPTGIYEPVHEGLISETRFFDPEGTLSSWYRVRAVDTSGNESRPGNPVRPVSMLE